jgi:protein-S-isoprenylcysteine O-methyltransferase Ste14
MAEDTSRPRHATVLAPPPLVFAVPLCAGFLLQHWWPFHVLPGLAARVAGAMCLALGMIGIPALAAFRHAHTSPFPFKPSTALVTSGPYRFTRNPMYVGFTLLYIGVSLVFNAAWPLFFLPVVLAVTHVGVVLREERYLTAVFGEPYREYCRRVRRWL